MSSPSWVRLQAPVKTAQTFTRALDRNLTEARSSTDVEWLNGWKNCGIMTVQTAIAETWKGCTARIKSWTVLPTRAHTGTWVHRNLLQWAMHIRILRIEFLYIRTCLRFQNSQAARIHRFSTKIITIWSWQRVLASEQFVEAVRKAWCNVRGLTFS